MSSGKRSDDEEDEWSREVDSVLESPEVCAEIKAVNGDVVMGGALIQKRRELFNDLNRQEKTSDQLQFITATLLEMLAQLATNDRFDAVFMSLSQMFIRSGSIAAIHVSNDYKPFRMAIADVIRGVIANGTDYGNVFVDNRISFNQNLTSRYRREYSELEEIGSGGFGKVYKVKSKLDQQIYAVKKIKVKKTHLDPISMEAVLSEVRILASLDHSRIVRYHVSWFELEEKDFVDSIADSPFESKLDIREVESDDGSKTLDDSQISWASIPGEAKRPASKFFHRDGESTSDSDSSEVSSEPSSLAGNDTDHEDSKYSNNSLSFVKNEELAVVPKVATSSMPLGSYTVYIVMELCKWTLEDYLQKRNAEPSAKVSVPDAYTIFEDLLSALAYLHKGGMGIIHRDIKPSNIFLKMTSTGVRALLGDFGLACTHRSDTPPAGSGDWSVTTFNAETNHTKTEGIGTRCYAAPEQLASTSYNCSVDVYSLGLVMYEYFHTVNTGMERAKLMDSLRTTGKTSEEFRRLYKLIANVIESMVCLEPEKRPSAESILNQMLLHSPKRIDNLKRNLKSKDAEIKRLRNLIQQYKESCTCGCFETLS